MAVTRPMVDFMGGDYGGPFDSWPVLGAIGRSSSEIIDEWLRTLYSFTYQGETPGKTNTLLIDDYSKYLRNEQMKTLKKALTKKWSVRYQNYEEVKHWKRIGLSDNEMFVKLRELNRRKKT